MSTRSTSFYILKGNLLLSCPLKKLLKCDNQLYFVSVTGDVDYLPTLRNLGAIPPQCTQLKKPKLKDKLRMCAFSRAFVKKIAFKASVWFGRICVSFYIGVQAKLHKYCMQAIFAHHKLNKISLYICYQLG